MRFKFLVELEMNAQAIITILVFSDYKLSLLIGIISTSCA
jgi:hypothetical protein